MPPKLKVGLVCPRTQGQENDGDIRWYKHVCQFPNPAGFGPEYSAWRNALKRRMERQGISGYKHSTPAQWAAIQAYALTVEPIASNGMAAHWEANTNRGRRFTECLDFLLKDVAKKHSKTLSAMGLAVPPAPPVAPAAVATGNDRKSPQPVRRNLVQYILI